MPDDGAKRKPGRPPGSRTRKTAALLIEIERSGITPLAYMLDVLRDPKQEPAARMRAAESAAPYVHPKLAAITHSGTLELTKPDELTDAALAHIAAGSSARAIEQAHSPQEPTGVH